MPWMASLSTVTWVKRRTDNNTSESYVEKWESSARRQIGNAITAGYLAHPQGESEGGWSDEASVEMILEEPW